MMSRAPNPPRPGPRHLLAWACLAACWTGAGAQAAPPAPASATVQATTATTNTAAPSVAAAWRPFADPLLDTLVAAALQANPSLTQAEASLRQARALRTQQAAGDLPTVGAVVGAERSASRTAGSGRTGATNLFSAGLDASWEPDLFGERRATVAAYGADVAASSATLADAQVSLAAEVALAYAQLRANQQRAALARQSTEQAATLLQFAQWQREAGRTDDSPVVTARATLETARATQLPLGLAAEQGAHALAVLCGLTPEALQARLQAVPATASAATPTTASTPTTSPIPLATPPTPDSLPATLLARRPDVRAAEARVAAAQARVEAAEAARYPSLSLSATLGRSALSLATLGPGGTLAATLLGQVSAPLFDHGLRQAQVDAQRAALDSARAAWAATALSALQDVADTLTALRDDGLRLEALTRAEAAARRTRDIARTRQASGLSDAQTPLEAERSWLSACDTLAAARLALATDQIRLIKALGGGWEPSATTPDATHAAPTFTPPTLPALAERLPV